MLKQLSYSTLPLNGREGMKMKTCKGCNSTTHNEDSDNETLIREYLAMNKAGFDSVFGENARRCGNACAEILLSRGIIEIPNIFGPIKIRMTRHA